MIAPPLQQILDRAAQLPPDEQQALARQFQQVLDTFLAQRSPGRVYSSEEDFMRALGMSEERIARLLNEPVEPEPGEAYDEACADANV